MRAMRTATLAAFAVAGTIGASAAHAAPSLVVPGPQSCASATQTATSYMILALKITRGAGTLDHDAQLAIRAYTSGDALAALRYADAHDALLPSLHAEATRIGPLTKQLVVALAACQAWDKQATASAAQADSLRAQLASAKSALATAQAGAVGAVESMGLAEFMKTAMPSLGEWVRANGGSSSTYTSGGYTSYTVECDACGTGG